MRLREARPEYTGLLT